MAYDSWSELALVAVTKLAGAAINFQTVTETIDIDMGDKDFDTIKTVAGGRLVKFSPVEDTTITMEMYPMEAGTASGTTGTGVFDLLNTVDASQPLAISPDKLRNQYRVAIMWTDKTTETSAEAAIIAPTNQALRIVMSGGYFVSAKPSFTDGILKWSVKFKCPAFDKTGSANILVESVYSASATATLTALNSYSGTVKW